MPTSRKNYIVHVVVSMIASYSVEAENEADARQRYEQGSGDFLGYGDEHISEEISSVVESRD